MRRSCRIFVLAALLLAAPWPAQQDEPDVRTQEIPLTTSFGRTAIGLPKQTDAGN